MTTSVPQFRIETPLSTVSVSGARITVTIRTPDKPAVSCSIHAEKLVETLQTIEGNMKIVRADRYQPMAHRKMLQSIAVTIRDNDIKDFAPSAAGVACAALWCLLNDPKERDAWRKRLGSFLQGSKQAYVGLDLRSDGRYVYAMDGQPLLLEDMERASTEAEKMTAEAAEKAAKQLN